MRGRETGGDAGFTLIEVLASMAVIGVVLTAVTTFFVQSMRTVDLQGARQAAIQIAADGMERLRQVPGDKALDWITDHATAKIPVNRITYTRAWDPPVNGPLMTATVRVTWTDRGCPSGTCAYAASTLISTAGVEPLFEPAGA